MESEREGNGWGGKETHWEFRVWGNEMTGGTIQHCKAILGHGQPGLMQ